MTNFANPNCETIIKATKTGTITYVASNINKFSDNDIDNIKEKSFYDICISNSSSIKEAIILAFNLKETVAIPEDTFVKINSNPIKVTGLIYPIGNEVIISLRKVNSLSSSIANYTNYIRSTKEAIEKIIIQNTPEQSINNLLSLIGQKSDANKVYLYRFVDKKYLYFWSKSNKSKVSQPQLNDFFDNIKCKLESTSCIIIQDTQNLPYDLIDWVSFPAINETRAIIISPLFVDNTLYGLSAIEFDYVKSSISGELLEYLNDINKLYILAKKCQKQTDNNEEDNLLLKQIFNSCPIPLMLIDNFGNVIDHNETAKELLPTIKSFNNNISTYWNNFEASNSNQDISNEYTTKRIVINDSTYNLLIHPIKDFDGSLKGFLEVAIDITPITMQQYLLEKQRLDLEKNTQLLNESIAGNKIINASLEELFFDFDSQDAISNILEKITSFTSCWSAIYQTSSQFDEKIYLHTKLVSQNNTLVIPENISFDKFPALSTKLILDKEFVKSNLDSGNNNLADSQLATLAAELKLGNLVIIPIITNLPKTTFLVVAKDKINGDFTLPQLSFFKSAAHLIELVFAKLANTNTQDINDKKRLDFITLLPVPAILTDAKGIIIHHNQQIEKLFNTKNTNLIGKSYFEEFAKTAKNPEDSPVLRTLKTSKSLQTEREVSNRTYLVSTLPILVDGKLDKVLAVYIETTEYTNNNNRLKEAMLQVEESSKLHNIFTAALSKELRTPLSSVLGFSELLLNESTSKEEQLQFAKEINLEGNKLLTRINNIIAFSRLDSDNLALHKEPTECAELFREIYNQFSDIANEKNLSFAINVDKNLPPLLIDRERLKLSLNNIIENGIKYTQTGGVLCEVFFTEKSPESGELKIIISDTGCGISKEQMPKLFEPYTYDEDADESQASASIGLDLPVARRLIHRMAGEISLDSAKNLGTTFTITFPDAKIAIMPQIVMDTTKQLQVLAVAGNNSNLNVLEVIFDRMNIEFKRANYSKEAMAILETYQPDAVLVDIWLAGSDGRKLGSSIRQDKRFKNTSIIAISADYNMGASLNKMVFDDILFKPFTQNEIARCLKLQNQ